MKHDIVIDELETHLSGGGLYKSASREFYAHLDACGPCRIEVARMDELSGMLRELKFDPAGAGSPALEPSLGFYARVRNEIVDQQPKEIWGLFSPGAAFFRRIAFASLLVLASLGSFLVTQERSEGGFDAATIMAQHDGSSASESADRDRILVTLASWRE
jgi:hypothetical protein